MYYMLVHFIVHVKVNMPYTSGSFGLYMLNTTTILYREPTQKRVGLGFWTWLKAKHFGTKVDARVFVCLLFLWDTGWVPPLPEIYLQPFSLVSSNSLGLPWIPFPGRGGFGKFPGVDKRSKTLLIHSSWSGSKIQDSRNKLLGSTAEPSLGSGKALSSEPRSFFWNLGSWIQINCYGSIVCHSVYKRL